MPIYTILENVIYEQLTYRDILGLQVQAIVGEAGLAEYGPWFECYGMSVVLMLCYF
jgi:hypothetical protein